MGRFHRPEDDDDEQSSDWMLEEARFRVAQILNQLINTGGATKNAISQFFADLSGPAHVRTGTSLSGAVAE